MATTQPTLPPSATRHAQLMRDAWGKASQRFSPAAQGVQGFVLARPTVVQGVYYVLTGLWPLLSLGSFQAVTGPKADLWLVQTVAILVTVIGAALCVAAYRRQLSPEVAVLALGSAAGLAVIDVFFVAQGRISGIYLLDAVVEVGLIGLLLWCWREGQRAAPSAAPAVNGAYPAAALAPTAVVMPPTAPPR